MEFMNAHSTVYINVVFFFNITFFVFIFFTSVMLIQQIQLLDFFDLKMMLMKYNDIYTHKKHLQVETSFGCYNKSMQNQRRLCKTLPPMILSSVSSNNILINAHPNQRKGSYYWRC